MRTRHSFPRVALGTYMSGYIGRRILYTILRPVTLIIFRVYAHLLTAPIVCQHEALNRVTESILTRREENVTAYVRGRETI